MSVAASDIEQRLAETLQAVAGQTAADTAGFARLRSELSDPTATGRPTAATGGQGWAVAASWRGGVRAVAAVAAIVAGAAGGLWMVSTLESDRIETGPGSSTVEPLPTLPTVDLAPATDLLYLLPPAGTDLTGGVVSFVGPGVDEGSAVLLGRVTEVGFDQVVIVSHLTSGSTFEGDQEPVTIAGRDLVQPPAEWTVGTGLVTVAEELPDGTWLEYYTYAGNEILEAVVGATTWDGSAIRLRQLPEGMQELTRAELEPGVESTHLSYAWPQGGPQDRVVVHERWFNVRTQIFDPRAGLLSAGWMGPAEETTFDGRLAYLTRAALPGRGEPVLQLTWATASGHVVSVSGSFTEDELRAFAAGLQVVDAETWQTELAAVNGE